MRLARTHSLRHRHCRQVACATLMSMLGMFGKASTDQARHACLERWAVEVCLSGCVAVAMTSQREKGFARGLNNRGSTNAACQPLACCFDPRPTRGSKVCVESIYARCYGARYVNVRTTKATHEPLPRPILAKVSALRLTHPCKVSFELMCLYAVYTNTF